MDLNVIIEKDSVRDSPEEILNKVKRCAKLGFKEIGLSVCIDGSQVKNIPSPPQMFSNQIDIGSRNKIKLYSRLNVAVDDGLQLHKLGQSPIAKQYHLLSLEPKTEKVFTQILGGNFDCDIITFDFTEKSIFSWRKANFTLPISRGILLEINYSQAFASQSNRHNLFCYGQSLVRKTKGKNILLSSGTSHYMFFRGPYCVSNLGLLFGLKENQSLDAVFINGINAIRHSQVRKNPAAAAVVLAEELLPCEKWVEKELVTTEVTDQQKSLSPEKGCSGPKRAKIDS